MTAGGKFRREIEDELRAQIEVLVDDGIAPTHLNAHQYIDIFRLVAAIISGLLQRYAIPVVRVPWETHLTQTTLVTVRTGQLVPGKVKRTLRIPSSDYDAAPGNSASGGLLRHVHAGRIDLDLLAIFVSAAGPGVTEIGMHPGGL